MIIQRDQKLLPPRTRRLRPYDAKYGCRDYRGGGRSSGRETIGRVAGGAIASLLLKSLGIHVQAYTKAIGPYTIPEEEYDFSVLKKDPLCMPHLGYSEKAQAYLKTCMEQKDSAGGIIECQITGLPAGIGEPVFDKLDALLAQAVLSVGAVKGFEIGDGFAAAKAKGTENNDAFCIQNGQLAKQTNHSGGTLGGMSDGSTVCFRAAIKPTPSISSVQHTVNTFMEEVELSVKGRHDPIIVPRAVVVIESMAALTVSRPASAQHERHHGQPAPDLPVAFVLYWFNIPLRLQKGKEIPLCPGN